MHSGFKKKGGCFKAYFLFKRLHYKQLSYCDAYRTCSRSIIRQKIYFFLFEHCLTLLKVQQQFCIFRSHFGSNSNKLSGTLRKALLLRSVLFFISLSSASGHQHLEENVLGIKVKTNWVTKNNLNYIKRWCQNCFLNIFSGRALSLCMTQIRNKSRLPAFSLHANTPTSIQS